MQPWRPFSNSLVSHTFEDFCRKFEKISAGASKSPANHCDRDLKTFFPFKITEKDTEMRLQSFRELREKVTKQREMIKKRDLSFENRIRTKQQGRKEELSEIKEEKYRKIRDVRETNEKRFGKQERYKSEGIIKGGAFELTQFSEDYTKMPPIGKKKKNSVFE
jgi:DNA anti-recombination protein RmuC